MLLASCFLLKASCQKRKEKNTSKEQAAEFLKKVSEDKETAEKFQEAFRAALVKAGKDAGFKFTRADLGAALAQMKAEIPEGELKGVVAGGCLPGIVGGEPPECHPR